MQHLLSRAVWDTDGVGEDLRAYVVDHLADPGAVLVIDETGDVKKGSRTVGVQRQYTGTAGRIENSQVAVYLTYSAKGGHALIDRELYLPRCWTDDPARCAAAGVPAGVAFATKSALATAMLTRALDTGLPATWVAGDEVYGADPDLRAQLEARGIGYVLAIAGNRRLPTAAGPIRADVLAAALPRRAWQRLSAGPGAKGQRYYDWACLDLPAQQQCSDRGYWWLLIRRSRRTGEPAFYRCYSPTPARLIQLVAIAGRRWTVEESFQGGKGLAGLDEHQVRRWLPWRRWTLLAMLAHALLAALTAAEREHRRANPGLIELTCAEVRRLLTAALAPLTAPVDALAHAADWSRWRRDHQYRAKTCHYACYGVQLS